MSFDVREDVLQMFIQHTNSSVLTFGMTCWDGNASKQDKNRLDNNIEKADGVVGRRQGTAIHQLVTNKLRTRNQQAGRSTQHASAEDGDAGMTKGGGKMEECLGVNVRPVVRVDCNLEE